MIARGPWLVAPTPDGVTVVFETDGPVAARVRVDGKWFPGGDGRHHVAHVAGLAAGRAHHYDVDVGGAVADEGELATAPATPDAPVRLLVYGDTRSDGDAHARVVAAMRGAAADFAVVTGDLVAASTPDDWQRFFDIEHSLLKATPIYPVFGNHESDSGGAARFAELFPVGGNVYSCDYGALHLAILDSNASLVEQARWLDDDLGKARARGLRHAIIVMHRGPFSSVRTPGHGGSAEARAVIVPVARAHGVDAIIAGHDHVYERGERDGLTYFVSGGGGAPLVHARSGNGTRVARSLHHYLVVDVNGAAVSVTARDDNGVAFDRVELASVLR